MEAREQMVEIIRAMNENIDVSALEIEDRSLPGWEGSPDVAVDRDTLRGECLSLLSKRSMSRSAPERQH